MGQVRHVIATPVLSLSRGRRRPSSNTAIAGFARNAERELGINPKTVAKWRKRPKSPHSTTLSEAEEAMVVAFRRHTLLPLACPREGGGLPLRVAAIDTAPDPVRGASLLPAARHIPSAGHRGR
jgi:hypothetical protein